MAEGGVSIVGEASRPPCKPMVYRVQCICSILPGTIQYNTMDVQYITYLQPTACNSSLLTLKKLSQETFPKIVGVFSIFFPQI
jgi:hypothetical protein